MTIAWDIGRKGRSWTHSEALQRFEQTPERMEMFEGKLFFDEEDRVILLGLLLENVGIDAAVRFGDPALWREAVASLT